MRRIHLLTLVALAGAALSSPVSAQTKDGHAPASGQSQPAGAAKIAVKTAADLPVHTYVIEGPASEFFLSEKPFREFVAKVKADLEADLNAYDIQDKPTLQGFYTVLQSIAVFEGKLDEANALTEKVRSIELKESKKLMTGQTLAAYSAAKKAGASGEAFTAAFKDALQKSVAALPWDVVREDVIAAKGRAEMISRELLIGQVKSGIDPVVAAAKGSLSSDFARGLISLRVANDIFLPLQPATAQVYGAMIAASSKPMTDNWTSTLVTLTDKDKTTPVVVCIWDSGVDISNFKSQLYVNLKETVNGKDDDGNGFIDDVNGIAFDLESNPVPELLHSVKELKSPLPLVESHTKGMMDLQANIESPEAASLKRFMAGLKADQVQPFMEDLGLYGNYSHGTHVAGIAASGNPAIRLLPCRLTFDFRSIPLLTPSEELSRKTAKAYADAVGYMKAAGVRVVNMSWGGSYKDVEESLEKKGVGKTPEERAQMAKKLFAIEAAGLENAIKSAPGILFIAAAGNSNNDNAFEQFIPSGLNLPNLITVGAVDKAGKPTGFTTFGKNVKLFANGFEVDSYVPGGKRMKYSGTSMAAPNATNLAAKLFAVSPSLTPEKVIDLMKEGAVPMEGHSELSVLNEMKSFERLRRN
jgi:subtilisin family serine protease